MYKNFNFWIFICFSIIIILNVMGLARCYGYQDVICYIASIFPCLPIVVLAKKIVLNPHKRKQELQFTKDALSEIRQSNQFTGALSYTTAKGKKSLLKREEHRSEIKKFVNSFFNGDSDKNGLFLTGESGSGKSFLVNFLIKDFQKEGYDVWCKREKCDSINIKIEERTKQIFIFDHFEKEQNYSEIRRVIKKISKKKKDCFFIFVFPENFLSKISVFFNGIAKKVKTTLYVLTVNEEDKKEYIEKIVKLVDGEEKLIIKKIKDIEKGETTSDFDLTEIMCEELVKVTSGISPLIEIEFLGDILSYLTIEKKQIDEYNFFDKYFESWVQKFEHKETALAILNMFSDFCAYSVDDIKYATFEPEEKFRDNSYGGDGEILNALRDNAFLNCFRGANNRLMFQPAHAFVVEKIRKYCDHEDIPEGQACHINNLKNSIQRKNKRSSITIYQNIECNYEHYFRKNYMISFLLYSTLITITIVNLMHLITESGKDIYIQNLFTAFVSCPSVIYAFNYCESIMRIKKGWYAPITGLCGGLAIVFSFICPNAWGIFMGFEIIVLSVCIFCCLANTDNHTAKDRYTKDSGVFFSIGCVVLALGFIYFGLFHYNILISSNETDNLVTFLKYSYYILFFLYATLSVVNHIKYSYIIGRIGYAILSK